MYKQSIGIVGGFGAYATGEFYFRLLDAFSSSCERNYPHMILDNNFTMPSRTKSLLEGRNSAGYKEVVELISESIKYLIGGGAAYIIIPCGTAHAYLEDIYDILPEARGLCGRYDRLSWRANWKYFGGGQKIADCCS